MGFTLPVEEIQIRDRHLLELRRLLVEAHEPFRLRIGQRLDQHGIDDAEDGGVDADAERQCENSNQSYYSAFEQHPRPVAQILEQRLHSSPPGQDSGFRIQDSVWSSSADDSRRIISRLPAREFPRIL